MIKYHGIKLGVILTQILFLAYAILFIPKLDYAIYADLTLIITSFSFLNLGLPFSFNTISIRNKLDYKEMNFVFWYFMLIIIVTSFLGVILIGFIWDFSFLSKLLFFFIFTFQFSSQLINSLYKNRDKFIVTASSELLGQLVFLFIMLSYNLTEQLILFAFLLKWGICFIIPLVFEKPYQTKSYPLHFFKKESFYQLIYNYLTNVPSLITRWTIRAEVTKDVWATVSLISSLILNGLIVIKNQLYVSYNSVYISLLKQKYLDFRKYQVNYTFIVGYFGVALLLLISLTRLIPGYDNLSSNTIYQIFLAEIWGLIFWHYFTQCTAKSNLIKYIIPYLIYSPIAFLNYYPEILLTIPILYYFYITRLLKLKTFFLLLPFILLGVFVEKISLLCLILSLIIHLQSFNEHKKIIIDNVFRKKIN